ncbi:hypothetical protein K503DRAFT_337342 [Rhizopogon vinicolor AM-OR11-026]|uniref:Uncharacterized protein n=1 Tax=Rhizopogon vinicolor AM-OR11-026 TaxID=1314800 RepID=A0A1B7MTN2_9AGAM|nr:hypothetical protein K503DRAFT_337342 [Rhizopogon vinicolor AM-OR11-026]
MRNMLVCSTGLTLTRALPRKCASSLGVAPRRHATVSVRLPSPSMQVVGCTLLPCLQGFRRARVSRLQMLTRKQASNGFPDGPRFVLDAGVDFACARLRTLSHILWLAHRKSFTLEVYVLVLMLRSAEFTLKDTLSCPLKLFKRPVTQHGRRSKWCSE